jgi:hypothetical protein
MKLQVAKASLKWSIVTRLAPDPGSSPKSQTVTVDPSACSTMAHRLCANPSTVTGNSGMSCSRHRMEHSSSGEPRCRSALGIRRQKGMDVPSHDSSPSRTRTLGGTCQRPGAISRVPRFGANRHCGGSRTSSRLRKKRVFERIPDLALRFQRPANTERELND